LYTAARETSPDSDEEREEEDDDPGGGVAESVQVSRRMARGVGSIRRRASSASTATRTLFGPSSGMRRTTWRVKVGGELRAEIVRKARI